MKNATLFDFLNADKNDGSMVSLQPSAKTLDYILNYSKSVDRVKTKTHLVLPFIKN